MKAIRLFSIATALTLAGTLTSTAGAATSPLPASLYPAGASITYRPSVSNHTMDCLWGFSCEGDVPLFHEETQAGLHRVRGWAQFAGVHHNGQLSTAFELFASRYRPGANDVDLPWAGAALADFQTALRAHRYTPVRNGPHLLTAGVSGAQVVERSGQNDIVVMAVWNGRTEVEAIVAFYRASPSARRAAIGLLAQQVRRALAVTSG
jgi:hypothetical protein